MCVLLLGIVALLGCGRIGYDGLDGTIDDRDVTKMPVIVAYHVR